VTSFRGWVRSVGHHGPGPDGRSRFELRALTADGPVEMVSGPDLMSLSWYPPDRLALGPVTFGGMVVHRSAASVRITCLDNSGRSEVWRATPDSLEAVVPEAADTDAVAVMWHLMDPQATRPVLDEILGRLLLWAWIDDRSERWHTAKGVSGRHQRWHMVPGRTEDDEPGIRAFARADLHALARLLDVAVVTPVTPATIRRTALALDHPSLDPPDQGAHMTLADEVDFLHACVPTRWSLAATLRDHHRRTDLARMVMAAPTADV
jgi:hypothetical protein